jgi:hypothetical protein
LDFIIDITLTPIILSQQSRRVFEHHSPTYRKGIGKGLGRDREGIGSERVC